MIVIFHLAHSWETPHVRSMYTLARMEIPHCRQNCYIWNVTRAEVKCPFSAAIWLTPLMRWICKNQAYFSLPVLHTWSRCCYPATMRPGMGIFDEDSFEPKSPLSKAKRSTPAKYNGNVLADPWTTPGAATGWCLGGGTAAALNKINGLAWQILALASDTEGALTLINEEVASLENGERGSSLMSSQ